MLKLLMILNIKLESKDNKINGDKFYAMKKYEYKRRRPNLSKLIKDYR